MIGDKKSNNYSWTLNGNSVLTLDNGERDAEIRKISKSLGDIIAVDEIVLKSNLNIKNLAGGFGDGIGLRISSDISVGVDELRTISNISTATKGEPAISKVVLSGILSDGLGKLGVIQDSKTSPTYLTGVNTYTGSTQAKQGALIVTKSGVIDAGSKISVEGGSLYVHGAVGGQGGIITVSQGRLYLGGTIQSGTKTSLYSGSILAGTGTNFGVTVLSQANSVISPGRDTSQYSNPDTDENLNSNGNSNNDGNDYSGTIGVLNLLGGLQSDFDPAVFTFNLDYNGKINDQINLGSGTLDYSGRIRLFVTDTRVPLKSLGSNTGVITLIYGDGDWIGTDDLIVEIVNSDQFKLDTSFNGTGYKVDLSGLTKTLQVSLLAIPEPSSMLLGGGSFLGLLLYSWKNLKKKIRVSL